MIEFFIQYLIGFGCGVCSTVLAILIIFRSSKRITKKLAGYEMTVTADTSQAEQSIQALTERLKVLQNTIDATMKRMKELENEK